MDRLRQQMYGCFERSRDALFNLSDALLSESQASSLLEFSLSVFFERRWPSIYEALQDGRINVERFIHAYNSDLADQLGNLLNRVVSMVGRYYGGIVPAPGPLEEVDRGLVETAQSLPGRVDAALARFALDAALDAIWNLVAAANKYVADVEPWTLAKLRKSEGEGSHAGERLSTALYNLVEVLRLVAFHCAPFLPATAEGIAQQLGISLSTSGNALHVSQEADEASWGRYPAGTSVRPGGVLFPKITLVEGDVV